MTLKPWREVIVPHEDVLEGKFQESEFAADLTKVVDGVAAPDYQDPVRFFERTVITEGMSLLLQSVVKRLGGKGGDPVVQLQTAFGGGKTHTMMAVLHVAQGRVPAKKLLGVPELLEKAQVKELVKANVAVLDGNALAPSQPREHGEIAANTLWGELAFQLGAAEGYRMVAEADRDGTSPGKEVLHKLLTRFGPAVVLMDETVAYLRQFEHGKSYKGGTYNSNLSFLQALTEAASRVPNAMVLASLPDSLMEVGDEQGKHALNAVEKLFGRIEAVWKPVGTEEAFEIVRRRLFGPVQSDKARAEVCQAFADVYRDEGERFPPETREAGYLRRLEASYPIHPEVFERLYEDWWTLPKFQRTRGVLRLMARLVHSLWRADNRDLLILPGSVPFDDLSVRNELVKYLPPGWDPIVDKDVDGAHAEPRQIDDATPTLGSVQACRRAARTIFLGSAPSVASQKVRGVGADRVRLGCVQPGQAVGRYDDALRRLTDRLHYLYTGNERYWFDTRTNLRREMEGRLSRFDAELHIYPAIGERLAHLVKSSLVDAVHIFRDSADIQDKPGLRLVVLRPDQGHKRKEESSKAIAAAAVILGKHGDKPREYQNRLLFLAPEASAASTLCDHVRRSLAWASIVDDVDELNLDRHHEKEAKKNLDEAKARVEGAIRETYRHLLVPMQDAEAKGGLSKVAWEDEALSLAGSSYEKAIATTTKEKEWVISIWAPTHLRALLDKWFWKDGQVSVGAQRSWLDTCRYLYMPRLATEDVFARAVHDGVQREEWFGYAAAERQPGVYEGVVFGAPGPIYLTAEALLLKPETAAGAKAAHRVKGSPGAEQVRAPGAAGVKGGGKPAGGTSSAPPAAQRRFHGTVTLDRADPIGSFASVVENVLEHFTVQFDTEVRITLDIEARRPEGFEAKVVRVVRENGATLKFNTAEFEEQ